MTRARRLAIAAAAQVMAADQAGQDTTEWVEQMIRGVVNLCADRAKEWGEANADAGGELDDLVAAVRAVADEEIAG